MDFDITLEKILSDDSFNPEDRNGFYNAIRRDVGASGLYVNLMVIAFDAGVFKDIYDEIVLDNDFFRQEVEKLENEFGLTTANAKQVVKKCCEIYGKKILMVDYLIDDEAWAEDNDSSGLLEKQINDICPIDVSLLEDGEKISKTYISRVEEAEKQLNIDDFNITATYERHDWSDEDSIKIVGEIISDELKYDTVIFIMIYNQLGQIIGADFREKISTDECNGFASFSDNVYFPKKDNSISKIIVRPVRNPADWF